MYLPLKYAASVPVASVAITAFIGALIMAVVTAKGSTTQAVSGALYAPFILFFAGTLALVLVPPNLFAAAIANRFGAADLVQFYVILAVGSIVGCFLVVATLNNFLSSMGGFFDLRDWRTYAGVIANAGVLSLTAVFYGTNID